eukprot:762569-Hanusia_phi.AAC.1
MAGQLSDTAPARAGPPGHGRRGGPLARRAAYRHRAQAGAPPGPVAAVYGAAVGAGLAASLSVESSGYRTV